MKDNLMDFARKLVIMTNTLLGMRHNVPGCGFNHYMVAVRSLFDYGW